MTNDRTIRVLLIDDSVVVRRVVSDVLSSDPRVTVAGTAPNGRIGLSKVEQLTPDLVILDMEMPELDGLGTLAAIRKSRPKLPVIMFSSLTRRGALATLDALALGASDYVTKPERVGTTDDALRVVREQLLAKVKALVPETRPVVPARPEPLSATAPPRQRVTGPPPPVEAVVIATSTGGPNALAEVLPALPGDLPVPVLVVQHMPPVFTGLLAERLDARSALTVREAVAGAEVGPCTAWIAPGDFHMSVARQGGVVRLVLHQGPPENSCRPSADVLFRSAAEVYGGGVLGVVMTGMGQDGLRGSQEVRRQGGALLAQDEATSVVWGMPGFVAGAGLAERVLPLGSIATAVVARVRARRGAAAQQPPGEQPRPSESPTPSGA